MLLRGEFHVPLMDSCFSVNSETQSFQKHNNCDAKSKYKVRLANDFEMLWQYNSGRRSYDSHETIRISGSCMSRCKCRRIRGAFVLPLLERKWRLGQIA